jgi:2,3-bisphosphoglycerate-independent phosphoglycerate mutase
MKPVVLIVMDGWGISLRTEDNATSLAKLPIINALMESCPLTTLDTSGADVGLPAGQMGNSEVGHLTMGAGRVVLQELSRINKAIADGSFDSNQTLLSLLDDVRAKGSALHLMGLLSDGGVHSHQEHLCALLRAAKAKGIERVYIHAILDGRDTPPSSAKGYMQALLKNIEEIGVGRVATISGRYYAMDRDKRWDRVVLAYNAIAGGKGVEATDPIAAIEASYAADKTDEFTLPTVIIKEAAVSDNDGMIFFNFRADRAREITEAFIKDDFEGFERKAKPGLTAFVTMTEYDAAFSASVMFPPQRLANILGEVISRAGLGQFRVAETEKYAHVTFFFNGGREAPFDKEDRLLIPSSREVATYDEEPEMKAAEIATATVARIGMKTDGFILVNFANADMVGHTGKIPAAVLAVEAVDEGVGRIIESARENGFAVIITSDHGNVEQMIDYEKNCPYTAHTTNPVMFIYVDDDTKGVRLGDGGLADVAPTVLKIMGLDQSVEMTGKSLF